MNLLSKIVLNDIFDDHLLGSLEFFKSQKVKYLLLHA